MSLVNRWKQWIARRLQNANGFHQLCDRLDRVEKAIESHPDQQYRDVLGLLLPMANIGTTPSFLLETDHPVAIDSNDHKFPRGTLRDNTRSPRFVAACERFFVAPLKALDLGCSGGGLVLDFLLRGHTALGLEGSDTSRKMQRAEWRLLKHHLMTCNIAKPFRILLRDSNEVAKFNVITAWEVMEHIHESDLPQLFDNVRKHLAGNGLFVGTIATAHDAGVTNGVIYHMTVKSRDWWGQTFASHGFSYQESHPFDVEDFCRGVGAGSHDVDYRRHPEIGFHFVARPN